MRHQAPSVTTERTPAPPSCCATALPGRQAPVKRHTATATLRVALRRYRIWGLLLLGLVVCGVLVSRTDRGMAFVTTRLLPEVGRHLRFVAHASWAMLPYFLLGIVISAWAQTSGLSERLKSLLARHEGVAIAAAAMVGATIPLCSCSVVPLIAALLAGGVPLAAIMAFWISSPLMSPAVFLLTVGALGTSYAIARLVAAILMGAAAGYATSLLMARGFLHDPLRASAYTQTGCCGKPAVHDGSPTTPPRVLTAFWSSLYRTGLFLGKWLLLAFCLEALIVYYIDPAWITLLLGEGHAYALPLAMLVGIPLYITDVAAVPIVQGLLERGMAPGAALTFLIAGPVTTIPAMVAVWALVRWRTFAIYLIAGILGSLAAGYLFQAFMG